MTTHRYIGSDGQVHARFTCERTDCKTWTGDPSVHGHCGRCGGRTHRGLLTYSWGQPVYGCASCGLSDQWTREFVWRTGTTGYTCQGAGCERTDTHDEVDERGWAKWMCPDHHWDRAVRSMVVYVCDEQRTTHTAHGWMISGPSYRSRHQPTPEEMTP